VVGPLLLLRKEKDMYGHNPYFMPTPYYPDPVREAKRARKALDKAIKKATEAAEAKHKASADKPKPKSRWEKIDIFHMFIGTFTLMLFVGPFIGLMYINMLKHFAVALDQLFK
jgi:hypothetical protein